MRPVAYNIIIEIPMRNCTRPTDPAPPPTAWLCTANTHEDEKCMGEAHFFCHLFYFLSFNLPFLLEYLLCEVQKLSCYHCTWFTKIFIASINNYMLHILQTKSKYLIMFLRTNNSCLYIVCLNNIEKTYLLEQRNERSLFYIYFCSMIIFS
jgi:hypothetical protein